MTPERIAELRALAGAATPGPIDVHRYDAADGSIDHQLQAGDGTVLGHASDWGGNGRAKGDAALWAAACNELPAALDEIERLRADVERLARELREAREAIRDDGVRCRLCNRVAVGEAWEFDPRCAEHLPAALADDGFPHAMEWANAPAIRASEGET